MQLVRDKKSLLLKGNGKKTQKKRESIRKKVVEP